MAYSTFADLVSSYGLPLLERLSARADDVDPIDPTLVSDRVAMALEDAAGFMDGYFQGLYSIPVLTAAPSGVSSLRACCSAVTISTLVNQKGYVRNSEDESLVLAGDRWKNWLKDVAKGLVTIPGSGQISPAPTDSAPPVNFVTFSKATMYPTMDRFV